MRISVLGHCAQKLPENENHQSDLLNMLVGFVMVNADIRNQRTLRITELKGHQSPLYHKYAMTWTKASHFTLLWLRHYKDEEACKDD